MIVEAINKRTGKTVKIEEAYSGQRFTCPYCGVDMHPVLKVPNPFFRCNEGEKHKHYLCAQLDGPTNKAYDPMLTNIEELFANLFNPVREKRNRLGDRKMTRILMVSIQRMRSRVGTSPRSLTEPV